MNMGILRVGTLSDFRSAEHKRGISDPQEGRKEVSHTIKSLVANPDEVESGATRDLKSINAFGFIKLLPGASNSSFENVTFRRTFASPDCYVLCFAKRASKETMREFEGADSCLSISDPHAFLALLTRVLQQIRPVVFRGLFEVVYQNKSESWNGNDWGHHPALVKELQFERQCEVRALWSSEGSADIQPVILGDFRLGKFFQTVAL
jgi:hypothetical protein